LKDKVSNLFKKIPIMLVVDSQQKTKESILLTHQSFKNNQWNRIASSIVRILYKADNHLFYWLVFKMMLN